MPDPNYVSGPPTERINELRQFATTILKIMADSHATTQKMTSLNMVPNLQLGDFDSNRDLVQVWEAGTPPVLTLALQKGQIAVGAGQQVAAHLYAAMQAPLLNPDDTPMLGPDGQPLGSPFDVLARLAR